MRSATGASPDTESALPSGTATQWPDGGGPGAFFTAEERNEDEVLLRRGKLAPAGRVTDDERSTADLAPASSSSPSSDAANSTADSSRESVLNEM